MPVVKIVAEACFIYEPYSLPVVKMVAMFYM